MSAPGILFDVDGTLVDSNYLHTIAWSRSIREHGRWAPTNAIHRLVGMGGDQLTKELFGSSDEALAEGWRRHYEELIDEVVAFPGASDLLRSLHDAGVRVVLASSSPAEHVDRMIDLLEVGDVLAASTSADDADDSKPAPDIFSAALDVGGVDPARALVVGDSIWDVRAAEEAGLGTIAVETGGFSRHELAEDGARAVYRDVATLLDQWRTSPLGMLVP